LANVTSQALKYDVITYTPYEVEMAWASTFAARPAWS